MLGREIHALGAIKAKEKETGLVRPYEYTPKVVSKGMFLFDQT